MPYKINTSHPHHLTLIYCTLNFLASLTHLVWCCKTTRQKQPKYYQTNSSNNMFYPTLSPSLLLPRLLLELLLLPRLLLELLLLLLLLLLARCGVPEDGGPEGGPHPVECAGIDCV